MTVTNGTVLQGTVERTVSAGHTGEGQLSAGLKQVSSFLQSYGFPSVL